MKMCIATNGTWCSRNCLPQTRTTLLASIWCLMRTNGRRDHRDASAANVCRTQSTRTRWKFQCVATTWRDRISWHNTRRMDVGVNNRNRSISRVSSLLLFRHAIRAKRCTITVRVLSIHQRSGYSDVHAVEHPSQGTAQDPSRTRSFPATNQPHRATTPQDNTRKRAHQLQRPFHPWLR